MWNVSTGNQVPEVLDYTDPTALFKNLEFIESRPIGKLIEQCWSPEVELCWACGWNARNQRHSFYGPRVRVMHSRRNDGIWAIGTRWILRDEPNDRFLGSNYITLKFLHKQPGLTIPLPKEIRSLSLPTDPVYFTLESRLLGETLYLVWPKLSQEEKVSYGHQMADALRQLRRFTAPRPQKVDGSQLYDAVLGRCFTWGAGNCFKIPYSVDKWLDNLGVDLRMGLSRVHKTTEPAVIEEKFQEVKAKFPACEPYVLSHGDLNLSNIIVKDGRIQGIIDWERAGYYPWWFERQMTYDLASDDSMELFDLVWDELEPEINFEKWKEIVIDKLFPAKQAWGHCVHHHPGEGRVWWKPARSANARRFKESSEGSIGDCRFLVRYRKKMQNARLFSRDTREEIHGLSRRRRRRRRRMREIHRRRQVV